MTKICKTKIHNMQHIALVICLALAFFMAADNIVQAQDNSASASPSSESNSIQTSDIAQSSDVHTQGKMPDSAIVPQSQDKKTISSLFFTDAQYKIILEALNRGGLGESANEGDQQQGDDEKRVKPANREVFLSGIAYVNENDWTIWINEYRLRPNAVLPPEIKMLKVYKNYVDVKWFDDYNNKIFPIRIRPHQRFNVDTRVFLPG